MTIKPTYLSVLDYEFGNPDLLWFMCVVPIIVVLYFRFYRFNKNAVKVPSVSRELEGNNNFQFVKDLLFFMQAAGLAGLILAVAQPRDPKLEKVFHEQQNEGIDIMITMDISASMLAQDFEPNRLQASIEVAKEFIENRPNDRIGLTVYGGEALL